MSRQRDNKFGTTVRTGLLVKTEKKQASDIKLMYNGFMAELERIAITGSSGRIGTVLRNGLTDFQITPIDLPEIDVNNYQQFLTAIRDHSAIIHLAWNTKDENHQSDTYLEENTNMFLNVYRAAMEANVPRVIMASSVEVSDWRSARGEISIDDSPDTSNLYGAHKVAMEAAGRVYSKKGLEVVCVRFGGVRPDNVHDSIVSLDHADCVSLIDKILKAEKVPNNFAVVHAVSNNSGRIHNIDNSFGWEPKY